MPTTRDPVEFTRKRPIGSGAENQRCGNAVQLEDENAAPINAANPLPVGIAPGGIADPLPVTLETAAGVATGTAANPVRTDPTGATAQPVTDNGGSLTVDGTVTANQGTAGAAPWVVTDNWTPVLRSDENLNDSDKTFTVAANQQEQVLWIWVEFTSTATAGTRQVTIELQDGAADVIAQWRAGSTQIESLTRYYCFAPANADLTAFRDTDFLMTPLPPTIILPAGYVIRVYDNKARDAAADDMLVQMMVARRTV